MTSNQPDWWYAARTAEGIERSGAPSLLRDLQASLNENNRIQMNAAIEAQAQRKEQFDATRELNSSITALAATHAAAFHSICKILGEQTQVLHSIEIALVAPLSTAAAERYQRGMNALRQGWTEPAIIEFDAAIEQDPFQCLFYFGRGLALGSLGKNLDAVQSFEQAMYYSGRSASLAHVKAGAAILGSRAAQIEGLEEKAEEILVSALGDVPNCAELHLALAIINQNEKHLRRAVSIAPELGPLAVACGIPHADHVCEEQARSSSSTIGHMKSALYYSSLVAPTAEPPDGIAQLLRFHENWRNGLSSMVEGAAHSAKQAAMVARRTLESSERSYAAARQSRIDSKLTSKALLHGLLIAFACIFVTFLWSKFRQALNYRGPADDLVEFKWKWQLGGGALILVLLAMIGYLVLKLLAELVLISKAFSQRKQRIESTWVDYRNAQELAASAQRRAANAHVVLTNVGPSLPARIYPLSDM